MTQHLVIIDYGSGNLRSAHKAFERAASGAGLDVSVTVTGDAEVVARADRVVLPGVGAFGDCARGLRTVDGMTSALTEAVITRGQPFLGICVGMQLMCTRGLEHGEHEGFGWIAGDVVAMKPRDPALKVPHMGWTALALTQSGAAHPVFRDMGADDQLYFTHSFHAALDAGAADGATTDCLATVTHGGIFTAAIGRDNRIGTQFHPEKSQRVGLAFLARFLEWTP